MTIKNQELVPSDIDKRRFFTGNLLFGNGTVPLISYKSKLYRFSLVSIDPFPTAADAYLQKHGVYSVSQLNGGDIVVGTKNGGLVFLDQLGQIERIVRKSDGLPSDWISSIYSDHQNGVWVATDSGVLASTPS